MKPTKHEFALLIVTAIAVSLFGADRSTNRKGTDKQMIVQGNNSFALGLYDKLRQDQGNLFCSPYSISTALAMTYAGAKGQTETQMAKVLHFPVTAPVETIHSAPKKTGLTGLILSKEDFHSTFGAMIKDLNARGEKGAYQLTVANALWGQKDYGFLNEFVQLIKDHYDGNLNEVDFVTAAEAARKTINTWVEEQTSNKIKNLIGPGVLDGLTRLVLTNAIYFKGNWARQFKKENTKDAPFTLSDASKVNVPMMNQTADFGYMEDKDFQALELPYVDDELSMLIFLPKEVDGLAEFEKKLTHENLTKWQARLRKREVIVAVPVAVPKFKLTSQFSLAAVLSAMGMGNAFSSSADFSGINGRRDLFISAVIHKAYVDVNEEGTEAAAATAVTMKLTSVMPQRPTVFRADHPFLTVFRADHPFLFLIRDNQSRSILFLGRLTNPKQ
ncbi:MAG: serpin family protein [Planctomycetota bacterium]